MIKNILNFFKGNEENKDSKTKNITEFNIKNTTEGNKKEQDIENTTECFHILNNQLFYGNKLINENKSKLEIINEDYIKYNNKIYYYDIFTDNVIVLKADADSFSLIDEYNYQKDKNHVYYENKIIDGLDPNSFKVIHYKLEEYDEDDIQYGIDKNYYFNDGKIIKIDNETFKYLALGIFKDKNQIIIDNRIYENKKIDIATFEFLDYYFFIDKNHIYYAAIFSDDISDIDGKNISIVEKADPKSFKIFHRGDVVAIDKNYKFIKVDDMYTSYIKAIEK